MTNIMNTPVALLTPEQLEIRRKKEHEKSRKKLLRMKVDAEFAEAQKAKRRAYDNERYRKLSDEAKQELNKSRIERYFQNREQENQQRAVRDGGYVRLAVRRLSGWHWDTAGRRAHVDEDYQFRTARDWYEQWFASLDDPELSPW